ncbi:hypothetical protein M422DRAFT_238897, partial [Sphaerobolus stellatus SS14]
MSTRHNCKRAEEPSAPAVGEDEPIPGLTVGELMDPSPSSVDPQQSYEVFAQEHLGDPNARVHGPQTITAERIGRDAHHVIALTRLTACFPSSSTILAAGFKVVQAACDWQPPECTALWVHPLLVLRGRRGISPLSHSPLNLDSLPRRTPTFFALVTLMSIYRFIFMPGSNDNVSQEIEESASQSTLDANQAPESSILASADLVRRCLAIVERRRKGEIRTSEATRLFLGELPATDEGERALE